MHPAPEQRTGHDLRIGIAIAVAAHAAVLLALGFAFVQARHTFTPPSLASLHLELAGATSAEAGGAPSAAPEPEAVPRPTPALPRPAPVAERRLPAQQDDETFDAGSPVAVPALPASGKRSFGDALDAATAALAPAGTGTGGDAPSGGVGIEGPVSFRQAIRPAYPQGARQRGEEGRVVLETVVGADGHPLSVTVATTSGFWDLDRAAVRAVEHATFTAATENGRTVAARARITIIFRLVK